jgi:hypothetical protein
MKIRPVEAELFHADRQTDRRIDRHDKVNSRLWQFCELAQKLNKVSETASVSIFGWNVGSWWTAEVCSLESDSSNPFFSQGRWQCL